MRFDQRACLHFRRRVAAILVTGLALAGAAVASAPAATADIDHSHDPLGTMTSATVVPGGLRLTGWAVDSDALQANATVVPVVDGVGIGTTAVTSVANATVRAKYHTGPTPGFQFVVPVDATAPHTVCVVIRNVGAGYHVEPRCVATPLSTRLTTAQRAKHNPAGKISGFTVSSTSMRVQGYATDPDWVSGRLVVVLYVNGTSTATVRSTTYPAPRPAGAGGWSAFDITVPVSRGAHLGCIWVVNVGVGYGNTFLGCRSGDTRGRASTGTVTVPALNTKVVAEAKKHVGQPYVWGATGPRSFDCSGLVQYSYGKFGYKTPRTSEDQFLAARLIPAERAVPGDLVLYHDSVGDVFHVGIYLSPGKTVAAVDESTGVAYQPIWDPSTATYGSFTHT